MMEKAEARGKSRDAYMDFLKGIAIVAMVAGHTVSDIQGMDFLYNLIYSFHMPLLFFVSAYIEEQNRGGYAGREGKMLVKRASALLLPYLSWTVIGLILHGGGARAVQCGGRGAFRAASWVREPWIVVPARTVWLKGFTCLVLACGR